MKKYKKGYKFKVCGHDELVKRGWIDVKGLLQYEHKDWSTEAITFTMIDRFEGKILTVNKKYLTHDWYEVEENDEFCWPVGTFDEVSLTEDHTCIEGITPIDSFFICKICGQNLREI